MSTQIHIQNAFRALMDDEPVKAKTPWERSNMSYAEWHKMYVKACDDAVKFRHQCEQGKFYNEEV